MSRSSFVERWKEELIAGVSSGLLLALSFPPFPMRFLSAVALVPLLRYFIVCAGNGDGDRKRYLKRGFWTGFIFGVSFFLILLFWVANLIPESSARMPWLMVPALVLLVLYLSCYPALFSLAVSYLVKRFGANALFAAPGIWSVIELARSKGELGFSWGAMANALAVYPVAIQGASFYGLFGLSFVIVLVNVLLAFALFGHSNRRRLSSFIAAVVVVAAHLGWGAREIARFDYDAGEGERGIDVAVLQPNVDLGLKWNPAFRDTIFRQIEDMTVQAAGRGPRLVIFPETAAPVSMSNFPVYRQRLKNLSRESDVDILIGYVDHTFTGERWLGYNSAGLFDNEGRHRVQYNKVNLLPFGERIPFSQYIPALSRLNFGQANFEPGKLQTIFQSSVGKFGVLICFESAFSGYTRRYVQEGAQFLVNITNDGWFGSRRGPIQHAEMAILRAVENRVTLLRSANTGISMIVDPVGRVRKRIDLNVQGIILGQIHTPVERPVYCRYGHLVFSIMAVVNIAAVLLFSSLLRRV